MTRGDVSVCKHCGHKSYRHILKQGPHHAVCMNITCPCENYEPRNVYEEMREAARLGKEAAMKQMDSKCGDCGHEWTHHNAHFGSVTLDTPTSYPCGEEACQCANYAFTFPNGQVIAVSENSDPLETAQRWVEAAQRADILQQELAEERPIVTENTVELTQVDSKGHPLANHVVLFGKSYPVEAVQFAFENNESLRHLLEDTTEPTHLSLADYLNAELDKELEKAGLKNSQGEESAEASADDGVNHPSHYQGKGPEAIEVARHLSFNLGSALKYIYRAGNKQGENHDKDLAKAVWYIEDERKLLNGEYDHAE